MVRAWSTRHSASCARECLACICAGVLAQETRRRLFWQPGLVRVKDVYVSIASCFHFSLLKPSGLFAATAAIAAVSKSIIDTAHCSQRAATRMMPR